MKRFPSLLVATILAAAVTAACVPGLTSLKQSQESGKVAGQKKTVDAPKQAASAKGPGTELKDAAPAGVPLPPLQRDDKSSDLATELNLRQEVNQAALDFAENIPHVKVVKTCFSKLYGGWNLFLYVARGKKTVLQQFQWNNKTKEWEPTMQDKDVPEDQLKYHVKTEVGDEKCFVLKNLWEK
jgi:hypothetical protein